METTGAGRWRRPGPVSGVSRGRSVRPPTQVGGDCQGAGQWLRPGCRLVESAGRPGRPAKSAGARRSGRPEDRSAETARGRTTATTGVGSRRQPDGRPVTAGRPGDGDDRGTGRRRQPAPTRQDGRKTNRRKQPGPDDGDSRESVRGDSQTAGRSRPGDRATETTEALANGDNRRPPGETAGRPVGGNNPGPDDGDNRESVRGDSQTAGRSRPGDRATETTEALADGDNRRPPGETSGRPVGGNNPGPDDGDNRESVGGDSQTAGRSRPGDRATETTEALADGDNRRPPGKTAGKPIGRDSPESVDGDNRESVGGDSQGAGRSRRPGGRSSVTARGRSAETAGRSPRPGGRATAAAERPADGDSRGPSGRTAGRPQWRRGQAAPGWSASAPCRAQASVSASSRLSGSGSACSGPRTQRTRWSSSPGSRAGGTRT
ncbi:hypothetical protein SUDANB178_05142 [Streptomyces sp. enrichment culture]